MRPVAPRLQHVEEVMLAEEQAEYKPLVAGIAESDGGNSYWVTRWTFTPEERRQIAKGADVFVSLMRTGEFPPIQGCVGIPDWTEPDPSRPDR